jgi:hypothetical protein
MTQSDSRINVDSLAHLAHHHIEDDKWMSTSSVFRSTNIYRGTLNRSGSAIVLLYLFKATKYAGKLIPSIRGQNRF